MQEQIKQLEQRVTELERMLTNVGMPYSLKETIRNEVILQEDSLTATTQTIPTPAEGEDLELSVYPTGILVFQWRGKQYKVPYIT